MGTGVISEFRLKPMNELKRVKLAAGQSVGSLFEDFLELNGIRHVDTMRPGAKLVLLDYNIVEHRQYAADLARYFLKKAGITTHVESVRPTWGSGTRRPVVLFHKK